MQLNDRERAELKYIKRHYGFFWGGPEQRGQPPMHETDATVSKYVHLGFLEHIPGVGYRVSSRAVIE